VCVCVCAPPPYVNSDLPATQQITRPGARILSASQKREGACFDGTMCMRLRIVFPRRNKPMKLRAREMGQKVGPKMHVRRCV
jgi:hypothetical protein